ncbi:MAG: AAA family ATPase [Clostridiales bacterium]|jgi:type II secretory pathway predicted ATPase ExeA|nr:AAA family ATPase [Clostridiales bacterium]
MFETFYNFTNTPFSRSIPSKNLYTGDYDELIERLKYTAQKQLFAIVLGDSGCGKTTTLRRFVDETQHDNFFSLYLSDSKLTPRTFYKNLLEQLGFEAKYFRNDAKRQLHKEIEIMKGLNGTRPVAIVDEAHLLSKEMLEEIRFLLNFKMDSQSPMALILSGQTDLWDRLKLQSYAAIRQRIDIQCIVARLDRSKTNEYISAQLAFAGAGREIFTEAAIDEIFKFSGGIPRQINKACTESLIFGAQNRKNILDDRMVKMIVEQELIGGQS